MGLSFRSVVLGLSAGLLLVTVLAIGALSLFNTQRSVDRLGEALQERISRGAADKLEALLSPARAALLEHRSAAARGLLPLDDQFALSDRLVERLRHEPTLTWLSYGDERGRFTGAWRREDGTIIANRSWIGDDGRGHLIEEQVQLLNKVYRTEIIASEATRDAAGEGYEWRRLDRVRTDETGETQWVHELLDRRGVLASDAREARDRYEWALDRLVAGETDAAALGFARLAADCPADRAAAVMLARAEAARRGAGAPPPGISLTRADIDAAS
jgi:hypothetical protein